ncbi:uncharacterized protein ANIA_10528 [Aspergillus nidulans FGSC A4]|uniref:Uncharacterized protein n=1 Tax=Emericella nidulans (strain FGSC A4 / ATCC 38163 / CBS 112.46 / NRRL 194 / M139) TaxID=227321 RepID=C8V489_EMENI|nr:hypothetical protein [Aspergillus nidulans FGSC A4]CBF74415.1 TPA: hypothetical protein ANIA_10528 [Aspergillus nidulans FGSC A4]
MPGHWLVQCSVAQSTRTRRDQFSEDDTVQPFQLRPQPSIAPHANRRQLHGFGVRSAFPPPPHFVCIEEGGVWSTATPTTNWPFYETYGQSEIYSLTQCN